MKPQTSYRRTFANLFNFYLLGLLVFFGFAYGMQWGKTGRGDFVAALGYAASWPVLLITESGVYENAGCTSPGAWPVRVGSQSH